jgi:hypothetical protein
MWELWKKGRLRLYGAIGVLVVLSLAVLASDREIPFKPYIPLAAGACSRSSSPRT